MLRDSSQERSKLMVDAVVNLYLRQLRKCFRNELHAQKQKVEKTEETTLGQDLYSFQEQTSSYTLFTAARIHHCSVYTSCHQNHETIRYHNFAVTP